MLPALALLAGAVAGTLLADDPAFALMIYLGLFVFCGAVSILIVAVLRVRNRRFIATAAIRISAHTIEYTNAKGRVIAFDRADPSLRALLARVSHGTPSEGARLPPSLIAFVSDQTDSIRLRGSDWSARDLTDLVTAATTRPGSSGSERPPERGEADGTPPAWDVLSARQVNEQIPGTMTFPETHPLTFALVTAFGSVVLLVVIVAGVAVIQ